MIGKIIEDLGLINDKFINDNNVEQGIFIFYRLKILL